MNQVKVLSVHNFPENILNKLRAVSPRLIVAQKTCHNLAEVEQAVGPEVEVLYGYHVPQDLSAVPRLRWVQLHSAGVNHLLDHPIMGSDILITTTSGIHATPIAEYVFASILAFTRHIPRMLHYQAQSKWPAGRWNLFVSQELRASTLGILGYGSIGREVARLARAFGMRVLAVKRNPTRRQDTGYGLPEAGDRDGALPDVIYPPQQLKTMLAQCDYVVVTAPLTPETHHLIGEDELRAMKPSAYLVNVSRGEIVDQTALVKALREGRIGGAGLDVFEVEPLAPESELWGLENVILSPHVSAFSPRYDERATDLFAENLRRYLAEETLLNLVDKERGY